MFLVSAEYNQDDGYDDQHQSTSYAYRYDDSEKETLWNLNSVQYRYLTNDRHHNCSISFSHEFPSPLNAFW